MRKLSLKNRFYKQKSLLLVLIPVFLLLEPIFIPVYIFSQNSKNNLKNLIIVNGIIQAQFMLTPSSSNPIIYMMDLTIVVTLGVADWDLEQRERQKLTRGR